MKQPLPPQQLHWHRVFPLAGFEHNPLVWPTINEAGHNVGYPTWHACVQASVEHCNDEVLPTLEIGKQLGPVRQQ